MSDSNQSTPNLEVADRLKEKTNESVKRICFLSLNDPVSVEDLSTPDLDKIMEYLSHSDYACEHHSLKEMHLKIYDTFSAWPCFYSVQFENLLKKLNFDYLLIYESPVLPASSWICEALTRINANEVDFVVAPQPSSGMINSLIGRFISLLTKCPAPDSSTFLLLKSAVDERIPTLRPAGRWLAVDLHLRIPKERKIYLVEESVACRSPETTRRLTRTELSFIKSYFDHRFGNASRLLQFCTVGFSGMFVDLTFYAIFQEVFRDTQLTRRVVPIIGGTTDLAVAGFLAVSLAMTWNFLLNRRLTFNDARKNGSIIRQYLTYAMGNALAIAVSLLVRLWLPSQLVFFNEHKLAAALVGIVIATGISFSMARYFVFKSNVN